MPCAPIVAAAIAAAIASVLLVLVISILLSFVQHRSQTALRYKRAALEQERNHILEARETALRESERAAAEEQRSLGLAEQIQANVRIAQEKQREAEEARRNAEEATQRANEDAEIATSALSKLRREVEARQQAEAALKGLENTAATTQQEADNALDNTLRRDELAFYQNRLQRAYQRIVQKEQEAAIQLLQQCPPSLRHWEWNYLMQRAKGDPALHIDTQRFRGGTGSATARSLRFSDNQRALLVITPADFSVYDFQKGARTEMAGSVSLSGRGCGPIISSDGKQIAFFSCKDKHNVRVFQWILQAGTLKLIQDGKRQQGNIISGCFDATGHLLAIDERFLRDAHQRRHNLVDFTSGTSIQLPTMPQSISGQMPNRIRELIHGGQAILFENGDIYDIAEHRSFATPQQPRPSSSRNYRRPELVGVQHGYFLVAGSLLHIGVSEVPDGGIVAVANDLKYLGTPAIHPSGKRLVFSTGDELTFLDVSSGREVFRMPWHDVKPISPPTTGEPYESSYLQREGLRNPAPVLAFSPDGTILAVAGTGQLRIFRIP